MAELSNAVLADIGTDEISTLDQLVDIQAKYAPSQVYLPFAHNIYEVNLNERQIYGPDVLSVQRDHKSEVLYFKLDRYFDYMDLTNTVCIVEYILPDDKERIPHIYIVPYYDSTKFMKEDKILVPWAVGGAATSKNGILEYALRFFKVEGSGKDAKLVYNLNTLSTKTKVLRSLEADGTIMKAEYDIPLEHYEELIYQVKNNRTTWTFI